MEQDMYLLNQGFVWTVTELAIMLQFPVSEICPVK